MAHPDYPRRRASLAEIREHHHRMAWAMALGCFTDAEIAARLEYSEDFVTKMRIKPDPFFNELIRFYRDEFLSDPPEDRRALYDNPPAKVREVWRLKS